MSITIRPLLKQDCEQVIEVHRMIELRLNLGDADLSPFAQLPARLSAQGITRSANPAMIRVNEKFGFERRRAEVRLVKRNEM